MTRRTTVMVIVSAVLHLPGFCGGAGPRIEPVGPRVFSCDYESTALGRPMRFLAVVPGDGPRPAGRVPVIYLLHGRGRNERTLLDNERTRARLLASRCLIVLPRGEDGWYVNAPAAPADRQADHLDEIVALAEGHFNAADAPSGRAIGGWSMGGFGAAYTACRRAGGFAALATVIGLLDFPRAAGEDPPGRGYKVPPRFGPDPDTWTRFNPRLRVDALRRTAVFVGYADRAPETGMNERFLADAASAGVATTSFVVSGGHTFPVVEELLPAALDFLERAILPNNDES